MADSGNEKAPDLAGYELTLLLLFTGAGIFILSAAANLDKKLFKLSKRNVLTSGAASCYPFVSYSICDDNGILLG